MASRKGARTTSVRRVIDRAAVREMARGEVDSRMWSSYGVVGQLLEDGSINTDGQHVFTAPEGVTVDVVLLPHGVQTPCRYHGISAGENATIMAPIRGGDEVLVSVPQGDLRTGPVIVAILNNASQKMPLGTDRKPFWQNDRVLIFAEDVPIDLRTRGGARVNMNGTDVVVNEGTRGVARIQDTTKLRMSQIDIQALAVALLTTGGFTPASAPGPSSSAVVFTGGEITSASGTVKSG